LNDEAKTKAMVNVVAYLRQASTLYQRSLVEVKDAKYAAAADDYEEASFGAPLGSGIMVDNWEDKRKSQDILVALKQSDSDVAGRPKSGTPLCVRSYYLELLADRGDKLAPKAVLYQRARKNPS